MKSYLKLLSSLFIIMLFSGILPIPGKADSVMATAPSEPAKVISTSHQIGISSTDNTINITWESSTDPEGDLNGYATKWSNSPNTVPWTKNLGPTATSVTSGTLSDSSDWYFHIRAVDNTGSYSDTAHAGPFIIDTQPNILSVNPDNGKNDSPVSIMIEGTDFMQGPAVRIGDTELVSVNFLSASMLRATIPEGLDPGAYNIKVTNRNGKSDTKENGFSVISGDTLISAGDDQHIILGYVVKLEGTVLPKPDQNWKYNWVITARPPDSDAAIAGTTLTPTFIPDKPGTYKVSFTVTDGEGKVYPPDMVNILVYKLEDIDVNKDSTVDLTDMVLALQVLTGLNPDEIQSGADVNSDGKIGVAEIVCILRILSK